MVFSSVPPNFLDHHHNWQHQLQQQQPGHQQTTGGGGNSQLPPPPPPSSAGGGGEGSIRPGSMVDRARLAKLPLPEPGLNCPRCDSTNTKFCYFNNYNLTQPRHFCKTCRRYWTRGGALRNVPVGGGCRRNKRSSKSRSSKSPSTNEKSSSQTGPKSMTASPSSCSTEMNNHFTQSLQLPFMGTALQSLSHQYGSGGGTISSNLEGFQTQNEMGFQLGSGNSNILSVGGGSENWRLPFLAGFELQNNLFQYNPSEAVEAAAAVGGEIRPSSVVNTEEAAPVKIEETRGLNLSRQLMGGSENSSHHWVGNSSWTEFSGLNSSSTTHFM